MKWVGVFRPFGPTITPQNHAAQLLGRGVGFWYSRAHVMAGRVLFPYRCRGLFACSRHAPGVSAHEVHRHWCFYGMTLIVSVHRTCIQWCLYEAAWIWRLRIPLGIGQNLFHLTFPLGASCAVNSPRFRSLYKASWEVYLPHLWFLGSCRSYKFFHFLEQQMPPKSWALQLRQRMWRLKILLLFNWTKKSSFLLRPGTVASADRARFLIILQTPIRNVQELAKEEAEESEAKLRGAIEILEGAFSAIADSWRDPWRATS